MRRRPPLWPALLLLVFVPLASSVQGAATGSPLEEARRLIEQERPQAALEILEPLLGDRPAPAEAFLLVAYCRLMLAEEDEAAAALEAALDRDPRSIEVWQLKGALALERQRYEEAVTAFRRLQELEPSETREYDLNIGAALLLGGDLPSASRHFNRYLLANRTDSAAYFLVAKNYALAEHWELAVQHLDAAVRLDERIRRRARHDPNFQPMREYEPFVRLLATDSYRPPPDGRRTSRVFAEPYDGGRGPLLTGLLNALQLTGRRFDPAVEVTDQWALLWNDVRIKVSNHPDGGGEIELSAPPGTFSAEEWRRETASLFEEVEEQLALLSLHSQ